MAARQELVLVAGAKPKKRKARRREWTRGREEQFLSAPADTCNVTAAAQAAGMSLTAAYNRRKTHAAFRAGWAEAIATAYQQLELALLDRALNGTEKIVRRKDGSEERMRDYSNTVALTLLWMHRDSAMAVIEELGRNDPPQSPITGTCYLVGDAPTGVWSLHPGHLAAFGAAGWRFVAPVVGLTVVVKTSGLTAAYLPDGWEVGSLRASRLVVDGDQVIGGQGPAIADPVAGTVIDSEARIAIAKMLSALRQHGLIASE